MADSGIKDRAGGVISKAKRRIGREAPLAADEDGRIGIVRGALRAFGEGDMDGFVDAFADGALFECPEGKRFPGAGDHEGADAIRDTYVADAGRTYSSFGFSPETYIESEGEDAVVVFGQYVGEGVEGGGVDTRAVQVWEFDGNTVSAVRIYADSAAFPAVITEEDEREKAEKEKAEKEKAEKEEAEEEKAEKKEAKQPEASEDEDDSGDDEGDSDDDDEESGDSPD